MMVWHTALEISEMPNMLELAPMAETAEQSKTGSRVNEQGRDGLGGDQSAEFSCSRNIYCTAYQHISMSAYQHAAYSQCCRALLRTMKEEHTWRHLCKWKQLVGSKTDKRNSKRNQPKPKSCFLEQSWPTGGKLAETE